MSDEERPEPDRVDGAPHPRQTARIFGQDRAQAEFLTAFGAGRLHHAWLLTGPRGVGKATLAWHIARFLVAQPGEDPGPGLFAAEPGSPTLDMAADHPVFRRANALAEPGIHLCRRGWDDRAKRLRTALGVDEVRAMKSAFSLTAADGGWRVAIIDAADEMNTAAANALLKLLEEPPARTVLLLVCHQPAALLPTIRSRCRVLRLDPLDAEDLARGMQGAGADPVDALTLHRLTGGSVGEALRLEADDGLSLYRALLALLPGAGGVDRSALLQLAQGMGGAANAQHYQLACRLWLMLLGRLAHAGASGDHGRLIEEERAAARTLVPSAGQARSLADLQAALSQRIAHARAVNLDPEHVILDMVLETEKALRSSV